MEARSVQAQPFCIASNPDRGVGLGQLQSLPGRCGSLQAVRPFPLEDDASLAPMGSSSATGWRGGGDGLRKASIPPASPPLWSGGHPRHRAGASLSLKHGAGTATGGGRAALLSPARLPELESFPLRPVWRGKRLAPGSALPGEQGRTEISTLPRTSSPPGWRRSSTSVEPRVRRACPYLALQQEPVFIGLNRNVFVRRKESPSFRAGRKSTVWITSWSSPTASSGSVTRC